MLSGICANLSKAVCGSTLAHLIIDNDSSRFQYSHGFTNLLVSQTLDVQEGKKGQFLIRTNYSKVQKKKVMWPDSTVDDYLCRHEVKKSAMVVVEVTSYFMGS